MCKIICRNLTLIKNSTNNVNSFLMEKLRKSKEIDNLECLVQQKLESSYGTLI